jgi:hypothetical protein
MCVLYCIICVRIMPFWCLRVVGWLVGFTLPTQCLTRFNHLNIQISESATLNVFPLFFKRN